MNCKIFIILVLGFCLKASYTAGQENETPFTKGSTLLLASGSFSSSTLYGIQGSDQNTYENDYLLGLGMLHLVKNRFGIGGEFYTGRSESSELVNLETEILYLGPWARYYLSDNQTGSLYPQLSVVYVNFYSRSIPDASSTLPGEEFTGRGTGFNLGFGYAYSLTKHVNFEVTMRYNIFYLWGEKNQLSSTKTEDISFVRTQLAFSLAFGILFYKKTDIE